MEQTTHRSAAIRDGLGVGLAVGLSGVAFGAAAITAGLSVPQACVLSLLAFTGASQFALTGAVGAGGDLLSATSGALLLGGRNTLYGLRMADVLKVRGPRRLVAAHGVIDLARVVGARPFPLLRAFKEATGLPPHAYLNSLRVRRARHLLRSGVRPARVAAEVGFTDRSVHSTVCTPRSPPPSCKPFPCFEGANG